MRLIGYVLLGYLIAHVAASAVNAKYALELKWPSAVAVAIVEPFYTVTWLIAPHAAENIFTPLYSYEDPHHVSTGRVLVHRQPDGKWE